MSSPPMSIPDLDERFLQPEGWRWHEFNREERRLRFGTVSPKGNLPDAVVICLPGLSEFAEKYFEVARTCLDQNLSFWVIDWMGQGGSGRYLEDRQKRHGTSFQDDVDDLFHLYSEYVKHSSVHPDVGRIPLVMLAHSMGGNIGLQFIKQHPTIFHLAAFSAPLLGFSQIENHKLKKIAPLLIHASKQFSGQKYISDGGSWSDRPRVFEGPEALSSDPQRAKVHSAWFEGLDLGTGVGNSKKAAEIEAARTALQDKQWLPLVTEK
ncbi:MAG: alpha/beta hydrolase, partial [Pseudomonadota bacterium]